MVGAALFPDPLSQSRGRTRHQSKGKACPTAQRSTLEEQYMRRTLHTIRKAAIHTPITSPSPNRRSLRLRLPAKRPQHLSSGLWNLFQGLRVRVVGLPSAEEIRAREDSAQEGGGFMWVKDIVAVHHPNAHHPNAHHPNAHTSNTYRRAPPYLEKSPDPRLTLRFALRCSAPSRSL